MTDAGQSAPQLLVGLFVGGRSSRMGGLPKGLLHAPDSGLSLVERLLAEVAGARLGAEVVLVGSASAYAGLGLPTVADLPPDIGPLGGLAGLLRHAERRGACQALALACDLPRLSRGLIARLATEAPHAQVVLVRQGEVHNPMIARYATRAASLAVRDVLSEGQRSLQAVLERLRPDVVALALSPSEEATLDDWDTPSQVRGGGGTLG